ncbi:MAG: DUF1080 domain-containing protein [Chloroherpetonaceae bacterium]|nr:DUF1080 domain-containing protein [Chthonomonadaceae bacterium]MDW8206543.1 DUF1080 domain-containing protein [Chloroherpetonaceae bacterium]
MMRCGWGIGVACVLLAMMVRPVWGQNTLTSQEIAQGWLLLFDGETDFGWKARGSAAWRVRDGMIESDRGDGMLATTTEFADFELRAECWIDGQANSGIFLRAPAGDGEIDPSRAYEVNINDAHPQWPTGSVHSVARARRRVTAAGRWTRWVIRAEGDRLRVNVDGRPVLNARDGRFRRGVIALQHFGSGTVRFRGIALRPLGLRSLFNGRDLTGWSVIPGRRSVFTVTPEGWLNVKDGGGEIQSTAQFGDFVLQLEIFVNGTHLNSGVFFRSNPGAFWQGYESQIRNQWQGEDRSKPIDYGTGGLYNRQPARRVVSSDREWFTMTVIAHGLHFATWVNGVQVTDFVDTRPVDESNARNGARTRAGVIGLQGHDPTTDLSFRNIRAVEYPPSGL